MQKFKNNEERIEINENFYTVIDFSFGNSLIINKKDNKIELINDRNETQLLIKITSEGLIVNVNAEKLNVHAEKELNLTSEKINIKATEQINIKTPGNVVQEIGKDYLTEIHGTHKNIAQTQKITASLGNIELKANDDVKLNGESVQLNCDE